MGGSSVEWGEAVDAFIGKLRADNCTAATLKTYRVFLDGGRARRFREAHGVTHARQLDAELLQAMKGEFLADGLRAGTVDDYVRMWKTFARHCLEHGWGVDAAALLVKGPRTPRRHPPTLTSEEEARLIGVCCPRDRVLIRLVLETGLRRSDVARLTVDDIIETDRGWLLRVRQSKGRKDRGVPLSEDFAAELDAHVKVRPLTRCRALFLTEVRRPDGDYGPLSSGGIYHAWRRNALKAGVRSWPHKGRHTAATRWASNGLSPWAIQRALGHETLAMTQRYVDAAGVDLLEAWAEMGKRQRKRNPS